MSVLFLERCGEVFYVKFHFKTNQGIKNLLADEAARLASADPDYATRDLFEAIDRQEYPSWTFYIQVRHTHTHKDKDRHRQRQADRQTQTETDDQS